MEKSPTYTTILCGACSVMGARDRPEPFMMQVRRDFLAGACLTKLLFTTLLFLYFGMLKFLQQQLGRIWQLRKAGQVGSLALIIFQIF